jgi:hypothetical protein
MADECASFIRSSKDRPWFLYFAPHAVHAPYDPKPELMEKYRRRGSPNPEHAATVEALDAAIGTLFKRLVEQELDRNTLVIFTSDNGGEPGLVAPLRGSKGSLYHLRNDPGELEDLFATESARSKELLARLRAWQAATGAPRPSSPNPAFDPELSRKRGSKDRGPAGTNMPLQR